MSASHYGIHVYVFARCLSSLSRRKLDEGKTSISLLIFLVYCIAYTVSGVSTHTTLKGGVHKYLSEEGRQEEGLRGPQRPLQPSGGSPGLLLFTPPQSTALACSEPRLSSNTKTASLSLSSPIPLLYPQGHRAPL